MNLVLFLLIGAGINGVTFGLGCILYNIVKEKFIKGMTAVIFIFSVILTVVASVYIKNIYGYPSCLFVLFGYALSTGLFLLAVTITKDAE